MTTDRAYVRAISIGMPCDVDFDGNIFQSAIVKESVTGPVAVNADGLKGDRPAVHPDAIHAFSAESYKYWKERLSDTLIDWRDGFVGENLTIAGLDEKELAIGDVFRIGKQVVVQVLGPRIPCFKLAWRLRQPNSFLTEFALSGHCGYYLQVLEDGEIQAGDSITRVRSAEKRILLTHISELIFGHAETIESELEEVLAAPFLSETSALVLRGKLVRHREKRLVRRGRWKGWRPFIVESIVVEAENIRSIHLTPQDGGDVAGYLPGQFLILRLTPKGHGDVIRTYTISDYECGEASFRISVKKEANGLGSTFLHEQIKLGSVIEIKAPSGEFTLDQIRLEPAIFISAGIGITPVLSMAKAHAARGDEAPMMHFVHCAESSERQAFRKEVDDTCSKSERFRQHYVLENIADHEVRGVDYHFDGRIDVHYLEQELGETYVIYCGVKIVIPFTQSLFYICGPEEFQQTLARDLKAAGVPADHIRTESFSTTKGEATGATVAMSEVVLSKSGKSITWRSEDGLTLLELLEEHGIESEFGCRNGLCQSCKCNVNLGEVHYERSPNPLPEEGTALICCAKPGSAELHLDL